MHRVHTQMLLTIQACAKSLSSSISNKAKRCIAKLFMFHEQNENTLWPIYHECCSYTLVILISALQQVIMFIWYLFKHLKRII